jgi:hypothetical protein
MTNANPTTNQTDDGYTPTFGVRVRTAIYVLGVIWSVAAVILAVLSTDLSWPKWTVDLVAALGPIMPGISAAFGVHYAGVSE